MAGAVERRAEPRDPVLGRAADGQVKLSVRVVRLAFADAAVGEPGEAPEVDVGRGPGLGARRRELRGDGERVEVGVHLREEGGGRCPGLALRLEHRGLLGPAPFREFSLRYMAQIVAALKADAHARELPVILFSKGAGQHLADMADTGCAALGVDWTMNLADARGAVAGKVALQGNLDPAVMRASPEVIRREARAVLDSYGNHPGHVFNLGHGITPEVDPEHVKVLVDEVHAYGRILRGN